MGKLGLRVELASCSPAHFRMLSVRPNPLYEESSFSEELPGSSRVIVREDSPSSFGLRKERKNPQIHNGSLIDFIILSILRSF